MIDEIKYQWRLKRLYAKQAKTVRFYDRLTKKAKEEGKKGDDIDSLRAEASSFYFVTQEEIEVLTKWHLIKLAQKLFLPVPDRNDKEMWSEESGYQSVLSEKGIAKLRESIRRERKERLETYLPWVAGLTGLIGAITGLLAIILR